MTTATKNITSTLTPGQGVLTALRALAVKPSQSLDHLLHTADQQAELLRNLLANSPGHMLEHLTHTIPSIRVDYVATMPVPGITFWGNGTWCIHIRAGEPIDVQVFTGLHELKHIIDHPLRRRHPDLLGHGDWEELADYFAGQVLARKTAHATKNHDPTERQPIPPQSIIKTGGSR